MLRSLFHPVVADWFQRRFSQPTEAQRLSWPPIVAREHTLVAAPTGSGKTLAAFLASIDRLLRQAVDGTLVDESQEWQTPYWYVVSRSILTKMTS
jgi:ATP-dependent Lhr-like helicase